MYMVLERNIIPTLVHETPRVDAAVAKLNSVMAWDASLGTSWKLSSSLSGWQDQFYPEDIISNQNKIIYKSSAMFLEEYMNIYIKIKIVYICDIQNLYDTMT